MAVARYRILRLIGEGGMGAVYEAEQDLPRRTVALKIIKPGISSPELLHRFAQESQALGRLQHPGIAQIFEAGTADTGFGPQPYFAMEFIRGETLKDYAEERGLSTRQRLEMVSKVAEAAHHAHQRGLIHRDLKPANILVDESGQPKILDFGIARATDSDTQATSQTNIGQLVGTLAYMSPEQVLADPLEIDTRSDVYALGVILYELLARRLPYSNTGKRHETIHAIREEDPVRLSVLNRSYRGDIETIVATALDKDKTLRYGSAAELAADIQRYLHDEPIVARPATAAYQLRKFARRHRALVAGVAAAFVALTLGMGVSLWQAAVADRERDRATTAEALATAQRNAAIEAERRAMRERDRAVAAETAARQERDRAHQAEAVADQERGRTAAAEVAATAQRNVAVEAEQRATRERDRALAADAQVRQDRDRIVWQNLARESIRLAATRTDDDLAALLARQAFVLSRRGSSPSRTTLTENALQQTGRASPWSHRFSLLGSESGIGAAAFSLDGAQLATNGPDGSIEIWDLRRPGSSPRVLPGRPGLGPALFAAFSPDGRRLATGGFETSGARGAAPVAASVKLWDLGDASASPVLLHGHAREVVHGAFSPDGTQLVTTDSQTILLWDLRHPATPARVLQQQQPSQLRGLPSPTTRFVAFSLDGSRLATRDNDGVRIWDMRNPVRPAAVLQGSVGALRMAFSPDGIRLAASCTDGVRLWHLQKPGAPRVLIQVPQSQGGMVAFSPDGARLAASVPVGSAVHVWEVENPATASLILRGHLGPVLPVAFSPDGSRLVSAGMDRAVRIWELQRAGAPVVLAQGQGDRFQAQRILSFAFSSDGSRLYGGTGDGEVRTWNLQTASAAPLRLESKSPQQTMSLSSPLRQLPDPEVARALSARGSAGSARGSAGGSLTQRYSPDGSQLAIGGFETDTVRVLDLRNRTTRSLSVRSSPGDATFVAYSTDGSRLAAANQLEVRSWDLRTPDSPPVVIPQPPQTRGTRAMAFSMDNNRLAVGLEDVRVYDLHDPRATPLLLRGFPSMVTAFQSLAFSPGGELLAGGHTNGTTQLWDLRNPITPPVSLLSPASVESTAFSPDGLHLATSGVDGSVRLWPLESAAADYLCTRVWRNLSMDEWRLYVGESIPYERTCPGLPAGAGAPGDSR